MYAVFSISESRVSWVMSLWASSGQVKEPFWVKSCHVISCQSVMLIYIKLSETLILFFRSPSFSFPLLVTWPQTHIAWEKYFLSFIKSHLCAHTLCGHSDAWTKHHVSAQTQLYPSQNPLHITAGRGDQNIILPILPRGWDYTGCSHRRHNDGIQVIWAGCAL